MQSDKQIQNRSCSSSGREKCCANCHFLMKWDRATNGNVEKFPIANDERSRLARGEPPERVLGANWSPACFENVWDWANRRKDSQSDLIRVLTDDRTETCFFYAHTPGMFFPAAAELERREADRREARRDRKVAWLGIASGLGGVVVGVILTKMLG